jgi:outer membrane cobalamin receptor
MGSGCGASHSSAKTADRQRGAGTLVITADQIAQSGATTTWQAIRRLAPHLRALEHNGRPAKLQRRGQATIELNDAPLVFLDGIRFPDFRNLDQLPATTVETITILSLADGATYYGVNAVGGVILIRTKSGLIRTTSG